MAEYIQNNDLSERDTREQSQNTRASAAQRGAHLYVIQSAGGMIKIGRSSDPTKRLRSLQTSSGFRVKVAAVFEGRGEDERGIHYALSAHRLSGEWFRNSNAARSAILAAVGADIDFPFPSDENRAAVEEANAKNSLESAVANVIAAIHREAAQKAKRRLLRAR